MNWLLDVILGAGFIGILCWLILLVTGGVTCVFGIVSCILASRVDSPHYPVTLKLQIVLGVACFLVAAMGTVTGYVDTFGGLASATGAEKAQLLHMSFQYARVSFYAGLLINVVNTVLLGIAVVRTHSTWTRKSVQDRSVTDVIKKIPIIGYALVGSFVLMVIGVILSTELIEPIVTRGPGEQLPPFLGMNVFLLLKLLLGCSALGVVFLIILLVQSAITSRRGAEATGTA